MPCPCRSATVKRVVKQPQDKHLTYNRKLKFTLVYAKNRFSKIINLNMYLKTTLL